ncbi:MAG TPA: 2-C-methyl-D-erythritol 4-phosphate cytidylyltransferase [Holophagaceae bacterium]|nr:2-C-methyl-D-erythritol 4-phosphate cytidylyltransferase [Holophagaceae bacterium]
MPQPPTYLVIPAGGRGVRMGGGIPKQFREWRGRPLLLATLEAFFQPGMPPLAGIAVAVPPDRLEEVRAWILPCPLLVVAGGDSRQDSVAAALAALPGEPGSAVLIHDGVRPFPPAGPIQAALEALTRWDGALLGEPSTDTLKRVGPDGQVLGTEPREALFRAQTPQVARLGTWRKAFQAAREAGVQATDDVALLERLGLRVLLVESPATNLKVTTPEDWSRITPQGVVPGPTPTAPQSIV